MYHRKKQVSLTDKAKGGILGDRMYSFIVAQDKIVTTTENADIMTETRVSMMDHGAREIIIKLGNPQWCLHIFLNLIKILVVTVDLHE